MAARSNQSKQALFVISVAAELAGMHPQTLRQYDRLGLVVPARTAGRGRRYTSRDVQRLRDIQKMSQDEGINLAGIRRILELERRVEALVDERDRIQSALAEHEARRDRVFAASPTGEVSSLRRGERTWVGRAGVSGIIDEGGAGVGGASGRGAVELWDPMRAFARHLSPTRVRTRIIEGRVANGKKDRLES